MRSKKAVYNIATNLLLQVIVLVYGFIVPKIIISMFGSSINGLISSITQFLAYIALLESGFGPVVKSALYKPIANKDNKTIANILKTSENFFRKIAYIFLGYIVILCFIYPVLANNDFDWFYTTSLIIIIGFSTFAEYFFGMTYRLFLQAEQKTYIISIIQIITYLIAIVVIIILAKIGTNIQIIKLFTGIIFVLRPLCQNLYVKKKYNITIKRNDKKYNLKQKWDGLAQHIASVIHENTDITILTFFCSLSEVSVYSVYYLVVKGIKSLIQSFSNGIDSSFGDMIAKKEHDNLKNKFELYEILYFFVVTITCTSTILLITPFISIYTKGVDDANYIRYAFGYLLVISEYIWAIRLPYSSITLAAGHFKETRKGAWIEAIINIVISVALVWKYGIIGVTIGTIVAMCIRTIEFMYHSNRYILDRNIFESLKKILLIIIETLIIIIIYNLVPHFNNLTYINWILNSIISVSISILMVCILNFIVYRSKMIMIINIVKGLRKNR